MNKKETFPLRLFIIEVIIYLVFFSLLFYLDFYLPDEWPVMLYRQLELAQLPQALQSLDLQISLVLGFLILAIILFATEKISVDIITLALLIGLVVSQILTPAEAFAGFSNDIIIILASIFVISAALQQTGIMDALGGHLLRIAGKSANRLIVLLMAVVGSISMFINNTTATAVFIPPTVGVAHRSGISPSKLLIPLAYASILGGTATLIGTSTNVAVSGYIEQLGLEPLSLFELTPLGLIIMGVGVLYMWGASRYLLPDYKDTDLAAGYAIREYLSEVVVMPGSELIGKRISESKLAKLEFRILAVLRGRRKFRPNVRSKLEEGDTLLVQGRLDDLIRVKETAGIEIEPDTKWDLSEWEQNEDDDQLRMAEVLIVPKSDLIGRTLKSANFFQRYGVSVLAIYRHGHSLREKINRIRLSLGDMLLIQGSSDRLEFLRQNPDFLIIEELSRTLYRKKKGLYTLIFLIGAVIAGGMGWLPLSIAFLGAAVLIILFRCITIEEAYEFIDWRLIILIGGMTAFGLAMEKTGAAEFLADWVIFGLESFGVMAVMAGFSILTIILTQPMSNAAAALVVLPVALQAAQSLGVNERTFAIAVMLSASISLITPFEPSCILVYSPGKYKFIDFVKAGAGLTLILVAIVLLLIPVFWPLTNSPG